MVSGQWWVLHFWTLQLSVNYHNYLRQLRFCVGNFNICGGVFHIFPLLFWTSSCCEDFSKDLLWYMRTNLDLWWEFCSTLPLLWIADYPQPIRNSVEISSFFHVRYSYQIFAVHLELFGTKEEIGSSNKDPSYPWTFQPKLSYYKPGAV